jgi:hypothetical protein
MRTVRNITENVEPGLYRQTRRIATSQNLSGPSPEKCEIPSCTPVNASQPHSIQQLAAQHPATVQDKYSSISTLKSIITKTLVFISKSCRVARSLCFSAANRGEAKTASA